MHTLTIRGNMRFSVSPKAQLGRDYWDVIAVECNALDDKTLEYIALWRKPLCMARFSRPTLNTWSGLASLGFGSMNSLLEMRSGEAPVGILNPGLVKAMAIKYRGDFFTAQQAFDHMHAHGQGSNLKDTFNQLSLMAVWGGLVLDGHTLKWRPADWVMESLEDDIADADAEAHGHGVS